MTVSEILFAFAPSANGITLKVSRGAPPPPIKYRQLAQFPLPEPVLDQTLLDALQVGVLAPAQRKALTGDVTTWLFGAADDSQPGNGVFQQITNLTAGLNATEDKLTLSFSYDSQVAVRLLSLPLEMTALGVDSLAFYGPLRAIVHELDALPSPAPASTGDWPFRLLLFRSEPQGLGAVPPLGPIEAELMQKIDATGNKLRVQTVTGRPGSRASFKRFVDCIAELKPHCAAFLGHGIVDNNQSYLAFEDDQGGLAAVDSQAIRRHLQNGSGDAIPLLMLVGCLTGAGGGQSNNGALLGIAQELIRSSLGVSASIGMRSRIDGDAARAFMTSFFAALLQDQGGGDLGAAVKAGRIQLDKETPGTLASFAPILLRARDVPSPLAFLERGYRANPQGKPRNEQLLSNRRVIWQALAALWGGGLPREEFVSLRLAADREVAEWAANTPLLLPRYAETAARVVTVTIDIHAPVLNARSLRFTLTLPTDAKVLTLRRSQALADQNLRLLWSLDFAASVDVLIEASAEVPIPVGPLFDLELELDVQVSGVREVGVSAISSVPGAVVLGECNAILVQAQSVTT